MPSTRAALVLALSACGPAATLAPASPDPDAAGDDASTDPYRDALPPVAEVQAPASARVGLPATFDGSLSSDPQGLEIVDYAWQCSDGSTADGPVVSLTFDASGTVSCELTVQSESGLTGAADAETAVRDGVAAWTFLVFINADNNLEDAGLDDLNEMEQAGSTGDVNIVVQIDRASGYSSADGNWKTARRYLVTQDDDRRSIGSTLIEDLGEVDSGNPDTVIDFGTWAIESFPAEHYALVMWDHGWGWSFAPDGRPAPVKGISSDDQSGSEISIANGEYARVLEALTDAAGQRLDLVGMDACLMGSWEIAHVAAQYADVYVASQDYEDYDGWPYDTALGDLVADPQMDALALGETIARRFHETRDSTQSAIDLVELASLEAALDDVALALLDEPDLVERYQSAAGAALTFEWGGSNDRDLGHFLSLLQQDAETRGASSDLDAAVAAAQERLSVAVASNYTFGSNSRDATGLSIYMPNRRVDSAWLAAAWAQDTAWTQLIEAATAD